MHSSRFLCVAFLVTILGARANAQWTVIKLNPAGSVYSFAFGVEVGQQAGSAIVSDNWHAILWTGSAASAVDLHPFGPDWSEGWGVGGGQQVGRVRFYPAWHASLWNGTAASWVDLAPTGAGDSNAVAVNGGKQVGWVNFGAGLRASLWSGTKASWTDLTPAGATAGAALGVNAGQQAGWALVGGESHAGRWSGTAASWVDMHPAGATGSMARDLDAGQQVGNISEPLYGGHASLWTGTAGSWVDLRPPGTTDSDAYAVHAGMQVGRAFIPGIGVHAFLWTGTAGSAVDLNAFLPPEYVGSEARDIWSDAGVTYIAGYALNGTTNFNEAVLWVSAPACTPPDQRLYIYTMSRTSDANRDPILHFQDPNSAIQVTGYDVYRSSIAAPAPSTWPRVASDVADMDGATPNKQWVDSSGNVSPTAIWYYEVTGYNNRCPAQSAEGPF